MSDVTVRKMKGTLKIQNKLRVHRLLYFHNNQPRDRIVESTSGSQEWRLELVTSRECDAVESFIHKDIKQQQEHSAG